MIQFEKKYDINDGNGSVTFKKIDEKTVEAVYNRGVIKAAWDGETLKGVFNDDVSNGSGLIHFTFNDNGFDAKWKAGIEDGPMKGKWTGKLTDSKEHTLLKKNEWDIVDVNEKKILLSNCEGTSGVDVGLKTSAFKPVNNYDLIINYLNNLFFDDSPYPNDNSADYLLKYDKVDDLIILVGSTYLLRLGGDLFEDEYTLEELTSILSENGLNNTFLSFIQTYSDDGNFALGDLIEYLLIAPNQTVEVQCIDSLYGDGNFVIPVK